MPRISYTRNFEDVMIHRCLGHIKNGFYVDAGAYLPVADSNTFGLYQDGWRGIAIEPQSRFHALWQQQRPQDILVKAAVGDSVGEITFYELAGMEQNATTDPAIVAMHQREGRQATSTVLPQVSLNSLLEQHRPVGDIHLLCVDVEGAEKKVLQGLDRKRFRPWLIMLESTLPNRPQTNFDEWEPLLLETDYVFVYFDAVNRYYLAREHMDLQKAFTYPPCVWDQFVDYRLVMAQQQAASAKAELAQLKAKLAALAQ